MNRMEVVGAAMAIAGPGGAEMLGLQLPEIPAQVQPAMPSLLLMDPYV